jgi:uncharacterized secreted protein with C-terminal beta-propeller domain
MRPRKGIVSVMAFGLIVLVAFGIVIATQLGPWKPATGQELKKFSSCEQINSFLQENSGSYSGGYFASMGGAMRTLTDNAIAPMAAGAATGAEKQAAGAGEASEDYSTTNIQVEGVDEPDIVKNDGKYIYTVSGSQIFIIDAYPAEGAGLLSTINSTGVTQIFVNGDRLVVFGNNYSYSEEPVIQKIGIAMPRYYPTYSQNTYVHVYDITDRSNPSMVNEFSIDGYYTDARMIGDYVYLITSKGVSYGEGTVPLPMVYTEAGSRPACGCTDLYYFDVPDYSYQFVTIASLNVKDDSAEPVTKVIMSGYTGTIFVSQENIYLSYMKQISQWDQSERILNAIKPILPQDISSRITEIQSSTSPRDEKFQQIGEIVQEYYNSLSEDEKATFMKGMQDAVQAAYAEIQKETQKTVIQKIAISSGSIEYKAKGEVPGHLLNQFSLDENGGYLRVATTTGEVWGQNPTARNHIYVLDSSMAVVGGLEDLAPGERIYSARFIGNRAYLVTFKKTDPLFVIDLSEPTNPSLLGRLEIPGYSDYLHPYDETHIIGIGKEAVDAEEGNFAWYQGVKLALFDVSGPANPIEISKYVIGDRGTDSTALHEHKAFLFDKDKNLLVIPIQLAEINEAQYPGGVPANAYGEYTFQGAYVFNLDLENGFSLKGRITHVTDQSLEKSGYYWYSDNSIQRSLYIGNNLYTISSGMVKANSLTDLSELATIKLPVEQPPIYPLYETGGGTPAVK